LAANRNRHDLNPNYEDIWRKVTSFQFDLLKHVGASYRRDTMDERIIDDVKNRTGRIIDVQGGHLHGTAYELTVNAWPELKSLPAPADTDKDGMPDEWEKKNGLNPTDAKKETLHKFYTNIEVYINFLVK
jgi:hypothetical protein